MVQYLGMAEPIDLEEAPDGGPEAVLQVLPPDLMDLSDIGAARVRPGGRLAAMSKPPQLLPEPVAAKDPS